MKKFCDKTVKEYKTRAEEISLKTFNSIQEFHQLLKYGLLSQLKSFDLKFHTNDGFGEEYDSMRKQFELTINDINKELKNDYTFKEDFEKHFHKFVIFYDKAMKDKIESRIESIKYRIFDFKVNSHQIFFGGYSHQMPKRVLHRSQPKSGRR